MLNDKQENEFRLVLANAAKRFDEFAMIWLANDPLCIQAKQSANMCRNALKMETVRERKQNMNKTKDEWFVGFYAGCHPHTQCGYRIYKETMRSGYHRCDHGYNDKKLCEYSECPIKILNEVSA
ncbi:MAG: hypothetical protein NUV47_01110 [Patescibacteria group bacterium]|nr:hypothetical protein [Patescibacteria group bacterium]